MSVLAGRSYEQKYDAILAPPAMPDAHKGPLYSHG